LTMFGNLFAVTYSPNVLFSDENTVSAIHLDPYLTLAFHLSKFFNWQSTALLLGRQPTDLSYEEFFLTLIAASMFLLERYWKFSLLSYAPSAITLFRVLFSKALSTSSFNLLPSS
jgi:hypothetical protein